MRLHRFKIDETARDPHPGRHHHMRRFWNLYSDATDNARDIGSWHIETIISKPRPELSLRLHFGTAGSETPIDAHAIVLGSGAYFGTSFGRKLAELMTRETEHPYEGRDLSLRLGDGKLWWRFWTHAGHSQRGEFAKWREGSTSINPVERVLGPKRYSYEDLATADASLALPESEYPARLTLQRQRLARTRGRTLSETFAVDVDVRKGVPSHYDSSGGWKGDRTYGFGVSLRQRRNDWWIDATAAAVAWVLTERARTGFREAQIDA